MQRMKHLSSAIAVFSIGLGMLLLGGCPGPAEDAELVAVRDRFLSAQPHHEPLTLTETAARLNERADEEEPAGPEELILIGRINAGDLEPWDAGKASFVLGEAPEEGHGAGHDPDKCPFCRRKIANAPTAIVEFRDDGGVIPHDSRKLFGLQKNDIVTLRGDVTRGEHDTLLVHAREIHVQRR